jgi:malonyl-CoA O-methyltransferase
MPAPASSKNYPGPGELRHAEFLLGRVRTRLSARLDYLAFEPASILDLGCGLGAGTSDLAERFPAAHCVGMDIRRDALDAATGSGPAFLQGDIAALPFRQGSFDLIFASLCLDWVSNLGDALLQLRLALRQPGLLSVAVLGPGTLEPLRQAGHSQAEAPAAMQVLGDLFVQQGFADPVLDVDHLALTYEGIGALRRDISLAGACGLLPARSDSLAGPGHPLRNAAPWPADPDGRIRATVEIIFAHAWAPATGHDKAEDDGVKVISLDRLRRRGSLPTGA